MNEHQSPWARPSQPEQTPRELLEAHYNDADDPDDLDNMVVVRNLRDVTPASFPEHTRSPETERLEVAEEIGEEALEAAGIDEPEEIDGDAHMYTRDELRSMREAAGRLMDEQEGESVRSSLDRLMESFSEADVTHLQFYSIAEQDKILAQQSGDGQASTEAQQTMGWHQRHMSPAAQAARVQFSNLYNRANPR